MYSTSYNTNGTFAMLVVMMVLMIAINSAMGLLERRGLAPARWNASNVEPNTEAKSSWKPISTLLSKQTARRPA